VLRAILIDDEIPFIEELSYLLGKYPDIEITRTFTSSTEALEALISLRPDVVFLDIDIPYMNGLELALKIQSLYADVIIIFVTAYPQYALESFKAFPLDYLLKPLKEARLEAAIERLRKQHALLHSGDAIGESLKIKCFGRFEVSAREEIKWGTRRVKELFMYLIGCCGAAPTKSELINALFGGVNDKNTFNNLYVTVYKLRNLLDILDRERRLIRFSEDYTLQIMPGACDFTDFAGFARRNAVISDKNAVEAARALNLCTGEYLEGEDFPWVAEANYFVEAEYERLAIQLAGFHLAANRRPEAENILNALLLRNPISEEGYTLLLDLYMKNGDRAAFLVRYAEYAGMLRKELRVKPPEIYRTYFNRITK
jgi:two-component system, LytTR family, response regulator